MNLTEQNKPRCCDCIYWHKTVGIFGQCRINPPYRSELFPRTQKDDWCGHFCNNQGQTMVLTAISTR